MSEKRVQPSRIARSSALTQAVGSTSPSSSTSSSRAQSVEDLHGASLSESFHVGDRVVVGGTKPGVIVFIGDTHFSTGEWAGVILDGPVGKNDGSVAGRRYFSCEMNHGIFARQSKLSRITTTDEASASAEKSVESAITANTVNARTDPPMTEPSASTDKLAIPKPSVIPVPRKTSVSSSHGGGSTAGSPAGSVTDVSGPSDHAESGLRLKIGDRVKVSGSKIGVVRYIGPADFARGVWAGIELDERIGKNDGSVGSKRYFKCAPLHGLFAPLHKVTSLSATVGLPHRSSLLHNTGLLGSHRTNSQESLSSVGSTSSVSRSGGRMRLGVMSLSGHAGKTRSSASNMSPTVAGLQKALKEKQEHVEQLLKERDLERSEFAKTAAQIDEVENQIAAQKADHQRYVRENEELTRRLKKFVERLDNDKSDLFQQLLEEKRKVEDLQFTAEEAAIDRSDLEAQVDKQNRRVKELEERLLKETRLGERLNNELSILKDSCKPILGVAVDSQDEYLDHIEELTHKLSVAEKSIAVVKEAKLCDSCSKIVNAGMSETPDESVVSMEISRLKLQLQTSLSERGVFEMRIGQLTDDVKRVEAERDKMAREKSEIDARSEKMSAERDRLIKERTTAEKQLHETELKLKEVIDKLDETKRLHSMQMEELEKRTSQLQMEADGLSKAQQALLPYKQQVEEQSERIRSLTAERDSLKIEVQRSKLELSAESSAKSQIEDLLKKNADMTKEVDASRQMMAKKQTEIDHLQNEFAKLKDSSRQAALSAGSLSPAEQKASSDDIVSLRQRVAELEQILRESKNDVNAPVNGEETAALISKLRADKESAESQVDFLNSVIVDQHRKNEILQERLQVMESSTLSLTDSVTDALVNGHSSRLLAPRLFCDICDVFDLHDTDDCPQQGMSTSPPASQHHGCRNDDRPYCTICEVFDHVTEMCGVQTY